MTFTKVLIAVREGEAPSVPTMTVLQVPSDTIACVQGHLTGTATDQQIKRKKEGEG